MNVRPDDFPISRRGALRALAALGASGIARRDLAAMPSAASPDTVNVRDFGARGDGVADDTSAIQAAIGAGRHVRFPAGAYRTSRTLTLPRGTVLEGEDRATTTLLAASGTDHALVTVSWASDVTLAKLAFDGARGARRAGYGVAITRSANVTVRACRMRATPDFACWAYDVPGFALDDVLFDECESDVYIDGAGARDVRLERLRASHGALPSRHGIHVFDVTGAHIAENRISDLGRHHVGGIDYRSGLVASGIFLYRARDTVVRRNVVERPYWSGVVIGERAVDTRCVDNDFDAGQPSYGDAATSVAAWIEQAGCRRVEFRGNRLHGGLSVGDGGGSELTVVENVIRSPGRGIDIGAGAHDSQFVRNEVTRVGGRGDYGVYVWERTAASRTLVVADNRIGGFDVGVAVNARGGAGVVRGLRVERNTLAGNGLALAKGAGVRLAADCRIADNKPSDALGVLR